MGIEACLYDIFWYVHTSIVLVISGDISIIWSWE